MLVVVASKSVVKPKGRCADMRPSRGMGNINPSKVPKTITKRDGNLPVELYKRGGKVDKCSCKKPSK